MASRSPSTSSTSSRVEVITSHLRVLAILALALTIAGCGGEDGGDAPGGGKNPLVDEAGEPPYVNALEVEPASGDILMATNTGLYRIPKAGDRPERMTSTYTSDTQPFPVGAEITFAAVGPRQLIGSGHPDDDAKQPEFLGVIRSEDSGKTWRSISGLGELDLHAVRSRKKRLLGFDAGGLLLVSQDEGNTFDERAPPGTGLDLAVSPTDPERLVATTDVQVYRSKDGGKTWRSVDSAEFARLAWATDGKLYRADRSGQVKVSTDEGQTFTDGGNVGGEPWALTAVDDGSVLCALKDGTVMVSRDGGKSWQVRAKA